MPMKNKRRQNGRIFTVTLSVPLKYIGAHLALISTTVLFMTSIKSHNRNYLFFWNVFFFLIFQIPVKVEKQVPRTKCKKVPEKKCQDFPIFIPRKACKDFPKTVCVKDPINVPRKIPKKVCASIPKEVCNKIPVQIIKHVPKTVTKKVCTSTKRLTWSD